MKDPSRRESPKARAQRSEGLVQRAMAPLYRDPFEGLCDHARALSPEDRNDRVQSCPRCGAQAGGGRIDADAGCLLESMTLDQLAGLPVTRR